MAKDKQFRNLIDLVTTFPTEQAAHEYIASQRWSDGVVECPHCEHDRAYVFKDGIRYECCSCKKQFTAKTGTFMEASKLPTIKWIFAMYLVLHKKGISSVQLAKDIGTTQKTAWFVLQRIREAFANEEEIQLEGIVEIDETFVGGKNKNRHHDKKVANSQGRAYKDKTPVFGMLQRGGKLKAHVVATVTSNSLCQAVKKNVKRGSTIMSDEWKAYNPLQEHYEHKFIEHGKGQYVQGDVYINSLECAWSQFKRSIIGIYVKVSRKHLNKYVQEFVFRYNYRNLDAQNQINCIIRNMECRLKYKDLIAA